MLGDDFLRLLTVGKLFPWHVIFTMAEEQLKLKDLYSCDSTIGPFLPLYLPPVFLESCRLQLKGDVSYKVT